MKKIFRLICRLLIMGLILVLFACKKEVQKITDFSNFSSMTQDTFQINVIYDDMSGSSFNFSIVKDSDIKEIMDIIFSSTFENLGTESKDGNHTVIVIVQNDNEYHINVSINKNGKNYYAFSSNDLQNKIDELAQEAKKPGE